MNKCFVLVWALFLTAVGGVIFLEHAVHKKEAENEVVARYDLVVDDEALKTARDKTTPKEEPAAKSQEEAKAPAETKAKAI